MTKKSVLGKNKSNNEIVKSSLSRPRSRRLAYNGMAAWRSGGISALPFKSALPAAVAPNRSL
jgi:hypothetical protein